MNVQSLTTTKTIKTRHSVLHASKTNIHQSFKTQQPQSLSKSKKNTCLCPEPLDDKDLDRRETIFALLGSIWSITTGITSFNNPVYAAYGEDAKIEVPDMIGGMNNRVNQQCLIESLGNRECLVYLDPELKLYKGPNSEQLLIQLENAIIALNSLPNLIQGKKWSKVSGVLTGPMGTLITTMKQLSESADDANNAILLTKKVKEDLYAINAAVERKDVEKALVFQGRALDDLNEFILAL